MHFMPILSDAFIDSRSEFLYLFREICAMANRQLNIAVFGSGRGSNFQAILGAIHAGRLRGVAVQVVISNNSTAGILMLARAEGIPAYHISERQFSDNAAFVEHLLATLRNHDVNFIVLAGYMKRIPVRIIEVFRDRIVNIHPALLPKFGGQGMYGSRVHEAVIAANERFSGATVHIVTEEYDRGAIVLQKKVEVAPEDTAETLAAKVLSIEHELYPEALKMFAEGYVVKRETVGTSF
jgi:phosphoribosylglycinamide formyltransferase-1